METHLLRTFVTVARRGSFSAAAAELGYTQAAVSQQIAALEGALGPGCSSRLPVAPTEAGARLLEHAEPILLRLDAARSDVARMTQTPAVALAVGLTPLAAAGSAFAAALAGLRHRMPRLDVTAATLSRAAVAAGVARGELDLGLTDGLAAPGDPLPSWPRSPRPACQQRVLVVLPPGHPLAARRGLRLSDLADARWIAADDLAPPLAEIRRHAGTDGFRLPCATPGRTRPRSSAWPRRARADPAAGDGGAPGGRHRRPGRPPPSPAPHRAAARRAARRPRRPPPWPPRCGWAS